MDMDKKFGKVVSLYLGGQDSKAKQSLAGIQTNLKKYPELHEFDMNRMENI